jgi:hypothetical protein
VLRTNHANGVNILFAMKNELSPVFTKPVHCQLPLRRLVKKQMLIKKNRYMVMPCEENGG